LNDPTFVECARDFAKDVLESTNKSDESRLQFAFEKALARPVKQREEQSLLKFLNEQRQNVAEHKDDPEKLMQIGIAPTPATLDKNELTAWTEVCRVVLNLHESITRY
jgi:hypothetical protein